MIIENIVTFVKLLRNRGNMVIHILDKSYDDIETKDKRKKDDFDGTNDFSRVIVEQSVWRI